MDTERQMPSLPDMLELFLETAYALGYAKLMGLEICGGDIQNAYLQAPSLEKHYVICGPEFGLKNVGCCALIR
jgi:hypothetical protein